MKHYRTLGRIIGSVLLFWSLASLGQVSDREQPMDIEADSAEYYDVEGLTISEGNVRLTQGSILIQADRITRYGADGTTSKLIAEGSPANYVQTINTNGETVIATSNHMEYQVAEGVLILTGDARLTQQETTLTSGQIVYDVQRHVLRASSQGGSVTDRVRVTIPAATFRAPESADQ